MQMRRDYGVRSTRCRLDLQPQAREDQLETAVLIGRYLTASASAFHPITFSAALYIILPMLRLLQIF